jgi:ABC-2 type transport system ATP-binding protein
MGSWFCYTETGAARESLGAMTMSSAQEQEHHGVAVEVRDLVRQFGAFTAVDHINFEVQRGEIFGLLGPNGAGKTTTFRMLCGLLPASSGTLRVAGVDLRRASASARQRIGYVAQKFSLYGQLSVAENLEFFASAYNLRRAHKQSRIDWALTEFALSEFVDLPSGICPVVSSSGSRWRRRCCMSRNCFSWTSRRAVPIRSRVENFGAASPPWLSKM